MDCAAQDEFTAGADCGLVVGSLRERLFLFDGDIAKLRGIKDFSTLLTLNEFSVFLAGDDFDDGMFADGGHLGEKM